MKKSILSILAITAIAFTSCSSSNDDNPIDNGPIILTQDNLDNTNFKGNISGTVTLNASKEYTLTGGVTVLAGGDLVIPAGTVIKSSTTVDANNMFITVAQDAKIHINGEAGKPVKMISGKANPKNSDWGGLSLCGKATTNTIKADAYGKTRAEVGGQNYGGNDDNDSSGVIHYLQIGHTGSKFDPSHEYNGVSFFGVGRGTDVDYIYCLESGDDACEFFGGTVEPKHLVFLDSYDDCLDFADGHKGVFDYVYISGAAYAGVEGSNNGNDGTTQPETDAKIQHISIVKTSIVRPTDGDFSGQEHAIYFKEGGGFQAYDHLYTSDFDQIFLVKPNDQPAIDIVNGTVSPKSLFGGTETREHGFTIKDFNFVGDTDYTKETYKATITGMKDDTEMGAGAGKDIPTWATDAFPDLKDYKWAN